MSTKTETRSTLTGWQPSPGTYAWQQMWSPVDPAHDSTIEERIEQGRHYGKRRLIIVLRITWDDPAHGGRDRYLTLDADNRYTAATVASIVAGTWHEGWVDGMSATESDWCVLEEADAQVEAGVLF